MTPPWQRNQLYRHRANRDVAFLVERAFYIYVKNAWSLKVAWWNIGACHDPWPLGVEQRVQLPAAVLPDWLPLAFHARLPRYHACSKCGAACVWDGEDWSCETCDE